MRSRVQVVFWAATTVAVMLLGVTWTLAHRVQAPAASVEDWILLVVAGAGLAAATLVAARIVFVLGRLRRRGRQHGGR